MATALESNPIDNSWNEFCDRHAQAAAHDFSKSCMQYMNACFPENIGHVTYRDFLKKYVESFTEHFEIDFNKRRLHNAKISNGLVAKNEDENADGIDDGSPKMQHKPFFRRFVSLI